MTRQTAVLEQRLTLPADAGEFNDADVAMCDEPVRRYFRAAIAAGTPLAQAARLRMRGLIRLANRWLPFRADELLSPLHGYCWPASVAGGLLRGFDMYGDGSAAMSWKLLGLIPAIHTSGPDVARSALGRAVAEAIWLPTSLLPRYGIAWRADDDSHLVAEVPADGGQVTLHVTLDADGRVRSDHLDRWGDPDGTGTYGWFPFGITVDASHTFPCGITMPAEGTGGWFHGTDRWPEGEFFRYSISALNLV